MAEQAAIGAKAPARIKTLLVNELVEKWQGLESFVVVCPIGLDAISSNQFRGALRDKNITMLVVKNVLAERALQELKLSPAIELLDRSSALCYGGESVVDVAREVIDFAKKDDSFQVRGAFLEGKIFSAEQVKSLATMPNRTELFGQIIQLSLGPGGRLVSMLSSPAARLAGAIKALAEKLAEQAPQAPAAEEPEQAPAAESTAQDAQEVAEPKDTPETADTAEAADGAERNDATESLSDSDSDQPPPEQQQ